MAKRVVEHLTSSKLIEPKAPVKDITAETETIITNELMAEDRLNDEIREMLKKFETDIDKGRMDYKKVFDLTKQKLVKERNLVL